jgi:hypothetical protein
MCQETADFNGYNGHMRNWAQVSSPEWQDTWHNLTIALDSYEFTCTNIVQFMGLKTNFTEMDVYPKDRTTENKNPCYYNTIL